MFYPRRRIGPSAGSIGWTSSGNAGAPSFAWVSDVAHTGRSVEITSSTPTDAQWRQAVSALLPGRTYLLCGGLKGQDIVRFEDKLLGGTVALVGTFEQASAGIGTFDWTHTCLAFEAGSATLDIACRQTPRCLVEEGELHPGLADETTTRWGASVSGETVIRRSAIGLSQDGDVLLVGISESTTAQAIAIGMRHAGAWEAAQLDVNWSYPKFLVFHAGESGSLEAAGVFPGFAFQKDEYVKQPAPKDFFYIVRR